MAQGERESPGATAGSELARHARRTAGRRLCSDSGRTVGGSYRANTKARVFADSRRSRYSEVRVSSTFTCRVLNFSDKDFTTEVVAVDSGVTPPMTVFDSGVVTVSPNQDFEIGIDTGFPGFPAGVTYFCRFLKASKSKARAEITVSALAGAPDTLVVAAE